MRIWSALDRLIALSKLWNVDEALWILWVYKCNQIADICCRGIWTTPYEMSIVEKGLAPAVTIPVGFFGGPDGGRQYLGNLSMFVVDRVLMTWKSHDLGWAWLLQFNPDTALHIEEQIGHYKPYFDEQKLLPGFEDECAWHRESPDYEEGERVVDYVQIGDSVYPILESGRQGCVVQRNGTDLPIRAVKSAAENATARSTDAEELDSFPG